MSPKGTVNATLIADTAIDYLTQKGAFNSSSVTDTKSKMTTLTMQMINSVLSSANIAALDCPDRKHRLCGGCVIM